MRFSSPNPRTPATAVIVAVLALALGACGDDEDEGTTASPTTTAEQTATGPDSVTSTTLDPDATDATIPDLPQNDDPSAVQCTGPPEGVFDATAIIGEGIGAATQAAADKGCQIRVVVEDGKPLAVTQDYRPDRVNVAVKDGKVTKVESIG
jgi:hypothetical protein